MTQFTISNSSLSMDLLTSRLQSLCDAKAGSFWIGEDLDIHKFSLISRIIWTVSKIFPWLRELLGASSPEALSKNLTNLCSQIIYANDSSLATLFNQAMANYHSIVKKREYRVGPIELPLPNKAKEVPAAIDLAPKGKFEEIKAIIGKPSFDAVSKDLEEIDALIGGYVGASSEEATEFFGKLAKAIYTSPEGECCVRTAKEDESMPLASYLKKACYGPSKAGIVYTGRIPRDLSACDRAAIF